MREEGSRAMLALSENSPIYAKIRSINASKDLSTAILADVKAYIKAIDAEAEAILFGSRVRGDVQNGLLECPTTRFVCF